MAEQKRTFTSASGGTTIVVLFNAKDGSGLITTTRDGRTTHTHGLVREQDSPRETSDDD